MKRPLPCVLLVGALVLAAVPAGAQNATLNGTITANGTAVAGVTVLARATYGSTSYTAATDAQGRYSLSAPAGCYTLQASPSGTYAAFYYGDVPYLKGPLNVGSGDSLTGLDFHLLAATTVSGAITPASGALPSSYSVSLYTPSGQSTLYTTSTSGSAYAINGVAPGTYVLYLNVTGFAPTYSGNAYTSSAAAPITVGSSPVTGVDVTLQPLPSITGKVTLPDGTPLAWGFVRAFPENSSTSGASAITYDDGTYTITGLFPGARVRLGASGSDSTPGLGFENGSTAGYTAPLLTLAAGTNSGHDFRLSALGSITGSVKDAATNAAVAGVSFTYADVLYRSYRMWMSYASGKSDASGTYGIGAVPPGRYFVSGTPATSDYHLPVRSAAFVEVGSGPANVSFTAALGGKVAGTVTKSGEPSTKVGFALLYLYDAACRSYPGSLYSGSDGTYTSPALPAGTYHLWVDASFANPPGLASAWYGGGSSCQTAGTVSVVTDATTNADVALNSATSGGGTSGVSGIVKDATTGLALPYPYMSFTDTSGARFYASGDSCGGYSQPLPAGNYTARVSYTGYQTLEQSVTVGTSLTRVDFALTPEPLLPKGSLAGRVTTGGAPLGRAYVCATANGSTFSCATADDTGRYKIASLANGTYTVVAFTREGIAPAWYPGSVTISGAGREGEATPPAPTEATSIDIAADAAIGADPYEPDETGMPMLLTPWSPVSRSFRDADDLDWFRFAATKGCTYKLLVTTPENYRGGSTALFKDRVLESTYDLTSSSGWTAPSDGERWIAMTPYWTQAYTVNLQDTCALGLNQARFQVTVLWKNYNDGSTGSGKPVALTGDSGYFWFFGPSNIELVIKVLDGTGVNGKFWVMYGALSDVEYDIVVKDTVTGRSKTYHNNPHVLASFADVNAFSPTGTESGDEAVTGDEIGRLSALQLDETLRLGLLDDLRTQGASHDAQAACAPADDTLCLNQSRFQLKVTWRNYNDGRTGSGMAVPLTSDSGYFWFFSASNIELVVKVLDGRSVNGKFWVMYGALSDVEYTITITDTETGTVKPYYNPPHNLASVADTSAF